MYIYMYIDIGFMYHVYLITMPPFMEAVQKMPSQHMDRVCVSCISGHDASVYGGSAEDALSTYG